MKIRPYRPDDLDETLRLWYRTWHATFPDLSHPQSFDEQRACFRDEIAVREAIWLAVKDGVIVGFFAIRQDEGYLDQLFVAPEAQRFGVGAALMAKAKALSPAGLTLHTLQQNATARIFWERHGFCPGRTGTNPINGQPNIEYCWRPEVR